jgi:hypothetical protein
VLATPAVSRRQRVVQRESGQALRVDPLPRHTGAGARGMILPTPLNMSDEQGIGHPFFRPSSGYPTSCSPATSDEVAAGWSLHLWDDLWPTHQRK